MIPQEHRLSLRLVLVMCITFRGLWHSLRPFSLEPVVLGLLAHRPAPHLQTHPSRDVYRQPQNSLLIMILLLQRSYAKSSMRWKQRSEDMQVKPVPQHSMQQPARHLPVLRHPHRLLPLRNLRRLLPLPLPLTVQTCGESSTAHPNSRRESRHHLRCHRLHPYRPSHDVCLDTCAR